MQSGHINRESLFIKEPFSLVGRPGRSMNAAAAARRENRGRMARRERRRFREFWTFRGCCACCACCVRHACCAYRSYRAYRAYRASFSGRPASPLVWPAWLTASVQSVLSVPPGVSAPIYGHGALLETLGFCFLFPSKGPEKWREARRSFGTPRLFHLCSFSDSRERRGFFMAFSLPAAWRPLFVS